MLLLKHLFISDRRYSWLILWWVHKEHEVTDPKQRNIMFRYQMMIHHTISTIWQLFEHVER